MRLREIRPEDAACLYNWRMAEADRTQFRSTAIVPYESHLRFLGRYFQPGNRDRWFVIESDGVAVGAIALYDLSASGEEAEWGRFVVSPEWRGQGVGRSALVLLLVHARDLGVVRLHCEALSTNASAIRLYESLGFREQRRVHYSDREFVRLAIDLEGTRP